MLENLTLTLPPDSYFTRIQEYELVLAAQPNNVDPFYFERIVPLWFVFAVDRLKNLYPAYKGGYWSFTRGMWVFEELPDELRVPLATEDDSIDANAIELNLIANIEALDGLQHFLTYNLREKRYEAFIEYAHDRLSCIVRCCGDVIAIDPSFIVDYTD